MRERSAHRPLFVRCMFAACSLLVRCLFAVIPLISRCYPGVIPLVGRWWAALGPLPSEARAPLERRCSAHPTGGVGEAVTQAAVWVGTDRGRDFRYVDGSAVGSEPAASAHPSYANSRSGLHSWFEPSQMNGPIYASPVLSARALVQKFRIANSGNKLMAQRCSTRSCPSGRVLQLAQAQGTHGNPGTDNRTDGTA